MKNDSATDEQRDLVKEYSELDKELKRINVELGAIEDKLKVDLEKCSEINTEYGIVYWDPKKPPGKFNKERFRDEVLNSELSITMEGQKYIKPEILDMVTPVGGNAAWSDHIQSSLDQLHTSHTKPRTWDLVVNTS